MKRSASDVSWVGRAPGHAVKVIHALLPYLPEDQRYDFVEAWLECWQDGGEIHTDGYCAPS